MWPDETIDRRRRAGCGRQYILCPGSWPARRFARGRCRRRRWRILRVAGGAADGVGGKARAKVEVEVADVGAGTEEAFRARVAVHRRCEFGVVLGGETRESGAEAKQQSVDASAGAQDPTEIWKTAERRRLQAGGVVGGAAGPIDWRAGCSTSAAEGAGSVGVGAIDCIAGAAAIDRICASVSAAGRTGPGANWAVAYSARGAAKLRERTSRQHGRTRVHSAEKPSNCGSRGVRTRPRRHARRG